MLNHNGISLPSSFINSIYKNRMFHINTDKRIRVAIQKRHIVKKSLKTYAIFQSGDLLFFAITIESHY